MKAKVKGMLERRGRGRRRKEEENSVGIGGGMVGGCGCEGEEMEVYEGNEKAVLQRETRMSECLKSMERIYLRFFESCIKDDRSCRLV